MNPPDGSIVNLLSIPGNIPILKHLLECHSNFKMCVWETVINNTWALIQLFRVDSCVRIIPSCTCWSKFTNHKTIFMQIPMSFNIRIRGVRGYIPIIFIVIRPSITPMIPSIVLWGMQIGSVRSTMRSSSSKFQGAAIPQRLDLMATGAVVTNVVAAIVIFIRIKSNLL